MISRRISVYGPENLKFVAAFDIDARKVGKPLHEAVRAAPNNTMVLNRELPDFGVTVDMGPVLDGCAAHMADASEKISIRRSDRAAADVVARLRETRAEVLVCYLPVGSREAVRFYAQAALDAGVALVNCVPVWIACDPDFAHAFTEARLPILGDDIRSQVGATIVHQRLVELLGERGYEIEKSYQLNVGGNSDFRNMRDVSRLADKKQSKTQAVSSKTGNRMEPDQMHIGPSDFVPHLKDQKLAFINITARGFCGAPLSIDLKLTVEDSPNSAGVVLDAIRYAKLGLDLGLGGPLDCASSYYMKSPPNRIGDAEACSLLNDLQSRHFQTSGA
jgi:myo-inositol-1-phosphate synthase